ncbi:MAG: hypothetical protein ABFD29_00075 [Anaerolineaceae bacterium]
MPTPTPEATEIPFTPEGFSIGELGLLQNPETGKNVLMMNPESDWQKFREDFLANLWQVNVDWASFTGQRSDALNYSTKEAFLEAALEGKKLEIGIPVRIDGEKLPDYGFFKEYKSTALILKNVEVKLDNIKIQVLDPGAFKNYTGMNWANDKQEAFACIGGLPWVGANFCLFTAEEENLVISVGNSNPADQVLAPRPYLLGKFDSAIYEKYPTYFRPDGIGVEADHAASFLMGFGMADLLGNASAGFITPTGPDGKIFKVINFGAVPPAQRQTYYRNPYLFIFSP